MKKTIIKNAKVVNEGQIVEQDVLIVGGRIEKIASQIGSDGEVVDGSGKYLLPGVIDDQVHFRDPGLTHKGDIQTESRAAVAGGITSFMEMPNTVPQALTQELLADKYDRASQVSLANYSFFMGAANDNIEEVLKTDPKSVCGVKVFMGSSTGNMLVDNTTTLQNLFSKVDMLIATHCEDEPTVRANMEAFKEKYGDDMAIKYHPQIRSEEACYLSSSMAVDLAKKNDTRLHILHISTAKEVALFDDPRPLGQKRLTSEACVHHLWFTDADYDEKGTNIKWNPAVKSVADREGIWKGLLNNNIDIVATDHAPHTMEEKDNNYWSAPSGGPLVQHALPAMLQKVKEGVISLERVVEKMCHAPALCFEVQERGYIREGYWADLVLVDLESPWTVSKGNILYKCGWSPFEGTEFDSKVLKTWVSGNLAYDNGELIEYGSGERLSFDR